MNETRTLTRPVAAPTVAKRWHIPATQVLFVALYWWALVPAGYLLLTLAVFGTDDLPIFQVIILLLSTAAIVLGATFATRIARAGSTYLAFVKGTTLIRVISIAWHLVGLALMAPVLEVIIPDFSTGATDFTTTVIGTLGVASFLGMLGPGYSEYREAMAMSRRKLVEAC